MKTDPNGPAKDIYTMVAVSIESTLDGRGYDRDDITLALLTYGLGRLIEVHGHAGAAEYLADVQRNVLELGKEALASAN